jgi:hypothetical protein
VQAAAEQYWVNLDLGPDRPAAPATAPATAPAVPSAATAATPE